MPSPANKAATRAASCVCHPKIQRPPPCATASRAACICTAGATPEGTEATGGATPAAGAIRPIINAVSRSMSRHCAMVLCAGAFVAGRVLSLSRCHCAGVLSLYQRRKKLFRRWYALQTPKARPENAFASGKTSASPLPKQGKKKAFPAGKQKRLYRINHQSMERETRFELATFSLATRHSTTELLPHRKGCPCAAHPLVGERRLELLRLAAPAPKAGVSAISPLAHGLSNKPSILHAKRVVKTRHALFFTSQFKIASGGIQDCQWRHTRLPVAASGIMAGESRACGEQAPQCKICTSFYIINLYPEE